jgi:hypothetical protein
MIITRTADTVEFQISESRRVAIDIARVASAALSFERKADGKLAPTLVLQHGAWLATEKIEGSTEVLAVMHGRIVELMGEIAGPCASAPTMAMSCEDDGFTA